MLKLAVPYSMCDYMEEMSLFKSKRTKCYIKVSRGRGTPKGLIQRRGSGVNAAAAEARNFQSTYHPLSVSEGGPARSGNLGRSRSLTGKEAAHPTYL
jgi:hypothetical protein